MADFVHPPAVVHIPENHNPFTAVADDPSLSSPLPHLHKSPAGQQAIHVDSPLSSPANSVQFDANTTTLEDDDEDALVSSSNPNLDLPALQHGEDPADPHLSATAAALLSIRQDRKERKKRMLMNGAASPTPNYDQPRSSTLAQLESFSSNRISSGLEDEEDQPFDHAPTSDAGTAEPVPVPAEDIPFDHTPAVAKGAALAQHHSQHITPLDSMDHQSNREITGMLGLEDQNDQPGALPGSLHNPIRPEMGQQQKVDEPLHASGGPSNPLQLERPDIVQTQKSEEPFDQAALTRSAPNLPSSVPMDEHQPYDGSMDQTPTPSYTRAPYMSAKMGRSMSNESSLAEDEDQNYSAAMSRMNITNPRTLQEQQQHRRLASAPAHQTYQIHNTSSQSMEPSSAMAQSDTNVVQLRRTRTLSNGETSGGQQNQRMYSDSIAMDEPGILPSPRTNRGLAERGSRQSSSFQESPRGSVLHGRLQRESSLQEVRISKQRPHSASRGNRYPSPSKESLERISRRDGSSTNMLLEQRNSSTIDVQDRSTRVAQRAHSQPSYMPAPRTPTTPSYGDQRSEEKKQNDTDLLSPMDESPPGPKHVSRGRRLERVSPHGDIPMNSMASKESTKPNSSSHERKSSASPPLDDNASWLARRLQQQNQTTEIDENASWLAGRVGRPEKKLGSTIDQDASWLKGQLDRHRTTGSNGSDQRSMSTSLQSDSAHRRTRDAPGGRPKETRKASTKSQARPQPGPTASAQHSADQPVDQSRSKISITEQEQTTGVQPKATSKILSTVIRKTPRAGKQKKGDRQQTATNNVPIVGVMPVQCVDDQSLDDGEDVGSLLESLDVMMKDLEGAVTPEKETNTRRYMEDEALAQGKSSNFSNDDTHSATQATSTLSSNVEYSHSREMSGPSDPTPRRKHHNRPVLVQPINNDIGIPKGDIMISLLSEDPDADWSLRIAESIWRCRDMRQNADIKWIKQKIQRKPNTPSDGRTSVLADCDDGRVVGGVEKIGASQKAALEHLKYDDLEDALALYEDIIETYYSHFEECLRTQPSVEQLDDQVKMYNSYIGACLHNIGIVYMLLSKPKEAHGYFEQATTKRAASLGVGHTDHIASQVKQATCLIAIGKQNEAVIMLEECLELSKDGARSISDQRQVAEIYNNLGCLYYAFGHIDKSGSFFVESFEAQQIALDHSLYAGARFSCHSASLNLAVTKANMGFLALSSRHYDVAIEALQYAMHNQQLLLRDAHQTLIATMEHLAVSQIFAGNKDKAIRLLRRMYHMQSDVYGPTDPRPIATNKKLVMLEEVDGQSGEDFMALGGYGGKSNQPDVGASERKPRGNMFKLFKSSKK